MDFGIAVATSSESWRVVERAEQLGFSHAWFYDTQLLSADCFVAMGAAAMRTSKIRLGTGVLIPSNRIAPVAANAFATLNKLAPGRIDFGVGTGFTGRRTMGLGAIKLADMAEYIRIVNRMLDEETVEWEFEGARKKIRFLNPDLGLINTKDPVRTHISAFGPKGRQLTAELGAGWLNFISAVPSAVHALEAMQQSWGDAGRENQDLYSTAFALGCVLGEGEPYDSPRAKAQAGVQSAVLLHNFAESHESIVDTASLPPSVRGPVEQFREIYKGYEPKDERHLMVHRGHLMFLRPEEEPLITGDLIRDTTFTATTPELRERVRALKEAGYSQFTVQLVEGHEDALNDWADVLEVI